MRKNRQSRFDWRKPRFHRSEPKILKGKAARDIKSSRASKLITVDLCTQWIQPISRETFDELVEKGALSKEQIENYLRWELEKSMAKERKTLKSKVKRHKDFALIVEISKFDIKTKEGAAAFKELLRRRPEAIRLIGEAQKLRAAG